MHGVLIGFLIAGILLFVASQCGCWAGWCAKHMGPQHDGGGSSCSAARTTFMPAWAYGGREALAAGGDCPYASQFDKKTPAWAYGGREAMTTPAQQYSTYIRHLVGIKDNSWQPNIGSSA